jgi:hypothetical protein
MSTHTYGKLADVLTDGVGLCRTKRRLLVVVGAGASVEFGMPSVNGVAGILSEAAQERYPLFWDAATNLYKYFEATLVADWQVKIPQHLQKTPTFEEILYAIFALAAAFPGGRFTSALGAFVTANPIPDINWFGTKRGKVDRDVLRQFGHFLVDTLLEAFRDRCRAAHLERTAELTKLRALFTALGDEFEVSIVTLNCDDIVYRSAPGLETGFDLSGKFVDERIVQRPTWPCVLHLHGSVHFDMRDDYTAFMGYGGLHDIHWQANLDGLFQQNADGRSSFSTAEGTDFPTSSIVAGYGKATQILRRPFRTYYAEVDRLVAGCDAAIFLGYVFSDIHLNLAFEKFRDSRRRPVVVIDFADDNVMNANGLELSDGHQTISSVLGLLKTNKRSMMSFGYAIPKTVADLKIAREFEISNDPDTPLAIWYNGMLAACDNIDKVLARLR